MIKSCQTLELKLPKNALILEEMRVRTSISNERYEEYRNLAENGKFNEIPYTIICRGTRKVIRLRNYFIDKYSNVQKK